MASPRCHYCSRDADSQCATCGRLYCPDHGEDVCLRCMAPESATPAALAYRGSLVALVVGTLVAVFLFLSPPESTSRATPIRTTTPAVQQSPTATPTPSQRPGTTPTAAATPSAAASPTTATATAPAERTHVVQAGETLSEIAARFGTTTEALLALNPGVTPETLAIGATLKIPPE